MKGRHARNTRMAQIREALETAHVAAKLVSALLVVALTLLMLSTAWKAIADDSLIGETLAIPLGVPEVSDHLIVRPCGLADGCDPTELTCQMLQRLCCISEPAQCEL